MADVVDDIMNVMDCDENVEIISAAPEELAETKKEHGNELYKTKQYHSALTFYSDAIKLCPETASYYGNRSACLMMMNRFQDALEDARKSVQLDNTFIKGYVRIAKCSIALGDLVTAESTIKLLETMNQADSVATEKNALLKLQQYESEAQKAYGIKDFRKVVYCMDRCLDEASTCPRYKLMKAECLAFLGRYGEAQEIANGILHLDKGNADAIYVRGICLFYEDNIDSSVNYFQQVLRLAPDHAKAMELYKRAKQLKKKKDEGNQAYNAGKYAEALDLFSEALKIDPLNIMTNAKLHFNRATALSKLNRLEEAIVDCTAALQLNPNYMKALLRRAKCHTDLENHEEAVKDYERINKMEKNRENRRLLQEAKLNLKKSKRKDYYKILGVDKNATEDEIKKAYRKRALVHHPDRHANASDSEKKEQEKKFKEVGEAYGILSDPKKKCRYDSGQDMEDFGCGGMSDIDPTQVFQSFFSNGHASDFAFGGGFPGGFSFQFG